MGARILLTLLLAALCLGACETNDRSFYVMFVQPPPEYPDCKAKGNESTPQGLLDIAFGNGYAAF